MNTKKISSKVSDIWKEYQGYIIISGGLILLCAECYHTGRIHGEWSGVSKLVNAIGTQAPQLAKALDNCNIKVSLPNI
jgi:hypothetical protein